MEKNKVRTVLITQAKPEGVDHYQELCQQFSLEITYRPFICIEGIPAKEFLKSNILFSNYSSVIFTSRHAVDHFFRIVEAGRFTLPNNIKYFCISETISLYIQKYTKFKKKKMLYGKSVEDLFEIIKKYRGETFLLPCSDVHKDDFMVLLESENIAYTKAVIYKTVCCDLSDITHLNYEILVFFSPSGIKSLFLNFPNFKQEDTKIAVFGPNTQKAAEELNLKVNIMAPTSKNLSMTMALANYLNDRNSE